MSSHVPRPTDENFSVVRPTRCTNRGRRNRTYYRPIPIKRTHKDFL
nr:MAG TPA: hypothetical protein [Caudoviricetes sp.]DAP88380.1 MAG TPA: hypothetical protein [Caudoviricetes sp.]DAW83771.1 MAG TPA: hypothetical protein [Caudoviricetes sp.]